MVSRREVLSTGVLTGAIGAALGAGTASAAPQSSQGDAERVVKALEEIRDELRKQRFTDQINQSVSVNRLRDQMRAYFRSRSHFPTYIDIGVGVWTDVYDWHVATHQPIVTSRTKEGYQTLALMNTTLVLRPDVEADYASAPYDER